MLKNCFTIIALIVLCTAKLYAQETFCTAGSTITYGREGCSISFTIGQPFYEIIDDEGLGTITPGVQQVYLTVQPEVTPVTEYEFKFNIEAYPNPVTNFLTLHIDYHNEDMNYVIVDNNGRRIRESSIESSITEIDMNNVAPSLYFLQVYCRDKRVQTFKIVKMN